MEEMKHSHEHHHECSCGTEEHEHQGCGCHHHHHEEGGLKSKLILIGVTVILLITAVFIEKNTVWLPGSYSSSISFLIY